VPGSEDRDGAEEASRLLRVASSRLAAVGRHDLTRICHGGQRRVTLFFRGEQVVNAEWRDGDEAGTFIVVLLS